MTTIFTLPERCRCCGGLGQVYYTSLKTWDECLECKGSGADPEQTHKQGKKTKKYEQLKMFENDNET